MNMNTENRSQRNSLVLGCSIGVGFLGHMKSLLIITPYVTKCTEKKINTFPENLLEVVTD